MLFLLRGRPRWFARLALHNGGVIAAFGRHFKLESVGGGRDYCDRVAAAHDFALYLVFVGPGPSVSVEVAFSMFGHAHAVIGLVGVHLLLGVIPEDGHACAFTHGSVLSGMRQQEKTALHPRHMVGAAELASGPVRAWFHVARRCPGAGEVT